MPDLSILGCYAHPDDEQGVLGTMRLALDEGIRVGLVCATRGEVGEIAEPSLATPDTLGAVREQELRSAMDVMGITQIYFLDYRDSGMDGTPENKDPRAFINANEDEAVGRLVKIIREFKPTIMTTFDETGGYGHPDHLAIHRWASKAFHVAGDASCYPEAGPAFAPRRLFYSAGITRGMRKQMNQWMIENNIDSPFLKLPMDKFGIPDERITNRVDVKKYVERKRLSMSEHKTQINPNGPFAKLPQDRWDQWRSTEQFELVAGDPLPAGADPGDLFAGLR